MTVDQLAAEFRRPYRGSSGPCSPGSPVVCDCPTPPGRMRENEKGCRESRFAGRFAVVLP
jgi:hypothetical protein